MAMFDCPNCGDTHHVNDFCATGPMSLAASPPAREEAPGEGAGERLLRPAGSRPTRCYCPPDQCGAPVIMGRQTPCLRDRTSEPAGEAVGAVYGCGKADLYTAELPDGTLLYTHPAPATADKLRVAVDLLNDCIWLDTDTGDYRVEHDGSVQKARAILAALNEER